MNLKENIARFRSWQKSPHYYSDQDLEDHRCANCGHEFKGNYCPVCGQNGDDGPITWSSVGKSFVSIWDLQSRSLPSSIWQLIWRPGYFIGEFISGHKQISHPPANMLFTVAVLYLIILQLFDIEIATTISGKTYMHVLEWITSWLTDHPAWNMMCFTLFMILPTWSLFRFAPLHNHHTIPESIFIQLFMSTLMLICSLFAKISPLFLILVPFYYIVTYRQLFGYGFWGTLWRLTISSVVWFNIILFFCCLIIAFDKPTDYPLHALIIISLFVLLISLIILFIGYIISKRTSKK